MIFSDVWPSHYVGLCQEVCRGLLSLDFSSVTWLRPRLWPLLAAAPEELSVGRSVSLAA